MKRILSLLCVLGVLFLLSGCATDNGGAEETPLAVTGEMDVAVLSVGKADAIVITTATKTVVIDTGETDDGGKVINYLNEKGRAVVDCLIITHYDRDHVGGTERLLNFAEVKQVIRPRYDGVREEYETFLAVMEQLQIPDNALAPGSDNLTFTMDDVEFTINSPLKEEYVNEEGVQQDNNFSLVVRARHGSKSFLFAGDAEDARLAELAVSQMHLKSDFLKLPYHGNFTELTATFLALVKPSYAVACDSDKNPTAAETTAALLALNCKSYGTRNGTVVCHSDGTTLTVTQTKD